MPLSWNEIKERAVAFPKDWEGTFSEDAIYFIDYFSKNSKRMEFHFGLYEKYTAGLFVEEKKKKTKK